MEIRRAELQKLVDEHMASGDYETAVFWAEKIVTVAPGTTVGELLPEYALYLMTMTAAGEWVTIITFISKNDLILVHIVFTYFYINALFKTSRYNEIITVPLGHLTQWDDVPFITPDASSKVSASRNQIPDERTRRALDQMATERKTESKLLYILARTYLMVQNRPAATGCLRHCLRLNPFASDAAYLAIESRLLKSTEVLELIHPTATTSNPSGYHVMELIMKLHNQETISGNEVKSMDLSIKSAVANRFYSQGDIQETYRITSEIIHSYGYYSKCFLMHVGCLVNLSKISELYALGHSMVKMQPEKEVTWYTVGCYYFATGQYTTAKKFLNKCTQMNAGFGEGWLAFGHALFYAEEHEQAMNCYLRASRILDGSFEPLLYIAVEYCFANNFKFANDFLQDAQRISGLNPLVLHEQATTAYMREDYAKAERLYLRTLNMLTTRAPDTGELPLLQEMLVYSVSLFWEPVYRNLGHTLRQLKKFEDAIEVHRKSLMMAENKKDAWGAIGVCYASIGELDKSIEALNTALTYKPVDEHLRLALDKVMSQSARMPLNDTIAEGAENFDMFVENANTKSLIGRSNQRSTALRSQVL